MNIVAARVPLHRGAHRTRSWVRCGVALALAWSCLPAPASAQRGFDPGRGNDQRSKITVYLLPNKAKSEFDTALESLGRGRVAEALGQLQPFVTTFANRAVAVQVLPNGEVRAVEESDTWLGIAWFLRKYFQQLPGEIREQAERIDGPNARNRLAAALAARDFEALLRIHRELPWTSAAGEALIAAAGLLFESGDVEEALSLYKSILEAGKKSPDASVAARVAVIEAALGRAPSVPRELVHEFVELGGERFQIKNLPQRAPESIARVDLPADFSCRPDRLLPDPGPIADRNPWYKSLLEEPVSRRKDGRPIVPSIVNDTIYISNGWSVAAFDIVSGKPRWDDPGFARKWDAIRERDRDDFVEAEQERAVMATAVSKGIVVAPLVVPLKRGEGFTFTAANAPVKKVIPFRKLHAFDAATGRLLWDHWRPEVAQNSKDFIDEYRTAGPPVIAGNRVIAPLYLMPDDATVEYHVTAFDLRTGKLVWDTNLLTGTSPINMFGRATIEFYCSPPAIDGDRIFVSTDLGAVASLDSATGQIYWIHRYETVPMPRSSYYDSDIRREVHWAPNAPAIARETAIFTPIDSRYLLAIDKDSGRRIGQLIFSRIAPDRKTDLGDMRYLVGIADNVIYVSGQGIVSIEVPTLDSPQFRTRDVWPATLGRSFSRPDDMLRPAMTETTILFPQRTREIVVLDRRDLKQIHTIPYEADESVRSHPGDVAVGDGVVITISNPHVVGYSNLEILVDLARKAVAANPKDPALVERLGRCLKLRGEQRYKNKDFGAAISDFAEAEQWIAKQRNADPLLAELYFLSASAHESRGEGAAALEKFRKAFDMAKNMVTRAEAGVALERHLPSSSLEEKLNILKQIERESGALRGNTRDYGNIPYGLYTRLRRAELLTPSEGGRGSAAQAVAALQDALRNYASEVLEKLKSDVRSMVRARIASLVSTYGPDCYASIEKEAAATLQSLGAKASPEDLSELIYTYPNSRAAVEATYRKLEQLVRFGRAAEVPAAAAEALAANPEPADRKRIYAAESAALRSLGNIWVADLIASAAESKPIAAFPDAPSPRGPATPLAATVSQRPLNFLEVLRPVFDDGSARGQFFMADRSYLYAMRGSSSAPGSMAGENNWTQPLPRQIFLRNADASIARDLIQFPILTVLNGVLCCVHGSQVVGYGVESGNIVFNIPFQEDIETAAAASGVVVTVTRDSDDRYLRVTALDCVGGARLWTDTIDREGGRYLAVANEDELLLIPTAGSPPFRMIHYELATGRKVGTPAMADSLVKWVERIASSIPSYEASDIKVANAGSFIMDRRRAALERFRIYDRKLIYCLPGIQEGSLVAFDLDRDGRPAWSLPLDARKDRLCYGLFTPTQILVFKTTDQPNTPDGRLISVNPRTGEQRVVAELPKSAAFAGMLRFDDVRYWGLPVVVTYTSEETRSDGTPLTRVDVIDLESSRHWTKSIPVRLLSSNLTAPAPGVGKDLIAIAYSCAGPSKGPPLGEMRIFRRDSGEYAVDRAFALSSNPVGVRTTDNSFAVVVASSKLDARIHVFQSTEK
jgi:outer membrane protein assembly factor BamB/tetratricopeptide (TPR) repeat protein